MIHHHHHHHRYLYFLLFTVVIINNLSGNQVSSFSSNSVTPRYHYFAIGSNMLPETMETLRQIDLSNCHGSAAVLPDYRLAFDIQTSSSTGAASVRYEPGSVVHGVLYSLTPEQFARISLSEGVPLVYLWERCQVVPYQGDGDTAGQVALTQGDVEPVPALVLTSRWGRKAFHGDRNWYKDLPSGSAYLNILKRGADYWKMDRSYQFGLAKVKTSRTSWDGSELLLKQALFLHTIRKNIQY